MHTDDVCNIFRRHIRPMEALATGETEQLRPFPGIRAVLFDVYGTLIISGSGDVGTAQSHSREEALVASLEAVGMQAPNDVASVAQLLVQTIRQFHEEQKQQGTEYPEVDIVEIWRRTLDELMNVGSLSRREIDETELQSLAVQYEARVNATWPMPGAIRCLRELRESGRKLGLISNAQFFTPPLIELHFGQSRDALGFSPELQFFSFESLKAKPGTFLFEQARDALAAMNIEPGEALYVGNDMLNDVAAAGAVGFRTALFAGDSRSLRLREGDDRVAGVEPDLVLTDLRQLLGCIPVASNPMEFNPE